MKTTTATPQNITAAAVVRALAQCLTLAATYGAQRTAAALRELHAVPPSPPVSGSVPRMSFTPRMATPSAAPAGSSSATTSPPP